MSADIKALLRTLHESRGSDLHLAAGTRPYVRMLGDLHPVKCPPLSEDDMLGILREVAPAQDAETFLATGDLDTAWQLEGVARYRVNFYKGNCGTSAAFREIPQTVPALEELGLPADLGSLALLPKGLVLITGPTGSGKSTTIAALVDHANTLRHDHIITIEDPIEFVYENRSCLVSQREVGRHTKSFAAAIRAALREDPDIIVVGEMRDLETISLALEAAETGHLVFATLHTISAAKTLDRIIQSFPAAAQDQTRASLSESIQAVISQVLLKTADGRRRVAALEVMTATSAIRNLIREGKTYQIPNLLQINRENGMFSLDDCLEKLVVEGQIDASSALVHATNRQRILACAPSRTPGTSGRRA